MTEMRDNTIEVLLLVEHSLMRTKQNQQIPVIIQVIKPRRAWQVDFCNYNVRNTISFWLVVDDRLIQSLQYETYWFRRFTGIHVNSFVRINGKRNHDNRTVPLH